MKARTVAAAVAAILIAQLASAGARWSGRPVPGPTAQEALVKAWVDANLAPDEVIAAVGNGQRIGYYTRRPTVAVPNPLFTARPWDLTTLHDAVRRHGVRIVVVTREAGAAFLAQGIPAWLVPVQQFSEVHIFRVSLDTISNRANGGIR